jgi:UDP-N-acetylmuramoyl-L-alanyl-D-glutamate--2,6-diaminopimelate ligase
MQVVSAEAKPLVVVDYAHTPDALEKALQALRPVSNTRNGRLIVLFGCGGDRDPGKRSLMGAVAARNADAVYITSDNPRSEQPERIIEQILEGIGSIAKANLYIEVDRAAAITKAIATATTNDVLLLAGKGHETTQIIGTNVIPFSDIEHAQSALKMYQVAA